MFINNLNFILALLLTLILVHNAHSEWFVKSAPRWSLMRNLGDSELFYFLVYLFAKLYSGLFRKANSKGVA